MDFNTACVMLALFAIVVGFAWRFGYLRAPTSLDERLDDWRRRRRAKQAEQELRDAAAELGKENE